MFSLGSLRAQIIIINNATPTQLVNNFILSGVTASNVLYTGGANTLGSFANGNTTNIGLPDGIIMTTGILSNIGNPVTDFATSVNGGGSDTSLSNILPGYALNDASILEFDLIPVGNVLEFNYVFASEEYPEYVGSSFNDVFGFFINGPDPQGGNYTDRNIAIIPGTTLPVAIDNVNASTNTSYFIDNQAVNGQTIVFDGFTTPLLAQVYVTPLSTYHLKMAIADAGDASYDSGIFLKAQSMKSYTITGLQGIQTNVSSVFPNPTKGQLAVKAENMQRIELIDLQGRKVQDVNISNQNETTIDLTELPKGIYFVKVITGADVAVEKVVYE